LGWMESAQLGKPRSASQKGEKMARSVGEKGGDVPGVVASVMLQGKRWKAHKDEKGKTVKEGAKEEQGNIFET